MKYIFKQDEAKNIHKFGVDISIYPDSSGSGIVYEEVTEGHFQEWYSDVSVYHWFIIEGNGVFVIDDEKVGVSAKDLVVVPPGRRIHYFGNMKMVLITTPPFDEKNEHQVRLVEKSESPYKEFVK